MTPLCDACLVESWLTFDLRMMQAESDMLLSDTLELYVRQLKGNDNVAEDGELYAEPVYWAITKGHGKSLDAILGALHAGTGMAYHQGAIEDALKLLAAYKVIKFATRFPIQLAD